MDTRTQRLMAEVIGSLADRECFLTQLEPCAEALGFDYFSYIVFSCYPASRPKMLIEGNFSANYLEDYRRQRVYLQDPVIERAHHSTLQFQWDESFITSGRRFGGIWRNSACAPAGRSRLRIVMAGWGS